MERARLSTPASRSPSRTEQACTAIERAGGRVLRPTAKNQDGEDVDVGQWLAIATDTEGNRFCVVHRDGCFLHPSLFPETTSAVTG